MKAERRHELQSNELARWLNQTVERSRGNLSTILWVGTAIVAVILAASLWQSRRSGSDRLAWQEYYSATAAEPHQLAKRLKQVADEYPRSEVALWARLDLADQLSYEGKLKLDTDPEIGRIRMKEAQQNYALVLASDRALPEMIRRAALPEAKTWELLGDRDKAIETYKQIASKYASTHPEIAAEAASRASELEKPEAADFYKWFAERKPTPPSTGLTLPGLDMNFPPDASDDGPTPDATGSTGTQTPAEPDKAQPAEPQGNESKDETTPEPKSKGDADSASVPPASTATPTPDDSTPKQP